MAELDLREAQNIAAALVTIGHPFAPAAINATAMDLVRWCKGAIIDGRILSPRHQAEALVEEARTKWAEGWPDRGGTMQLLDLFRALFEKKPEQVKWEPERGPICETCGGTGWELIERHGNTYAKTCSACNGKHGGLALVCPDCGGKESQLINGQRQWCKCVTPERRAQMRELFGGFNHGETA
jgi:hypothetical protein